MPRVLIGCAAAVVTAALWGCSSREEPEPQPPQHAPDPQTVDLTSAGDSSDPLAPSGTGADSRADSGAPDVTDLSLPPLDLPEPQTPRPIDIDSQRILDENSAEGLPKVIALLRHENPAVRLAAVSQLGRSNPPAALALKPLADALLDRNPEVAEKAAEALSDYTDDLSPVRAELVSALGRDEKDVLSEILWRLRDAEFKDAAAVPALRRLLRMDDTHLAHLALRVLAQIGPRAGSAVPDVLPWMRDESFIDTGEAAGEALARLGATGELLRLARSDEFYEELRALYGLGFVQPTTPPVRAVLLEKARGDSLNRDAAIEALGRTRPTTGPVFDALRQFLRDPDADARAAAAAALGHIEPKTEEAAALLLKALQDEDDDVRGAASQALGGYQTNPEVRVQALLLASQDTDFLVRSDAEESLAKSAAESLPILLKILEDPGRPEPLRIAAALVLGDTSFIYEHEQAIEPPAVRVLENAEAPDSVRCLAAIILLTADERHPAQAAAIIAGLKSTQPADVRERAAMFADNIGTAEVVPPLTAALDDPEDDVAEWAARGLGSLREKAAAAVPELCRVARLPKHAARLTAIEALGEIGATDGPSVPTLLEVVRGEDKALQRTAGRSLARLVDASREAANDDSTAAGAPAVDPAPVVRVLSGQLSSTDKYVREDAAESLGILKDLAAPAVPALAKSLSDEEYSVRYEAARALAAVGPAAKPAEAALLRAAGDESAREYAITALGQIAGDPRKVVPVLVRALENEDARYYAITALGSYGEHAAPAVAALTEGLSSAEDYIRRPAAVTLGKIGPKAKAALPKLTEMVRQDGDEAARDDAATAILQIAPESEAARDVFAAALRGNFSADWMADLRERRGDQLVTLYEGALGHEDAAVRRGALAELKALLNPAPFEAAFTKALTDSEPDVRLQAALALAGIGGHAEQVTPVLVDGLRHGDAERRWELEGAIGSVGPRAAPQLAALAADPSADNDLRLQALQMLGRLGQSARKAAPSLRALVQSAEPPLRTHAALALRRIQWDDSATAVPALLEGLKAEDAGLRAEAAAALGNGPEASDEVVAALLAALEDTEESVRDSAAYSLQNVGSNRTPPQKFSPAQQAKVLKLLGREDTRAAALTVLSGQETVPAEAVPLLIAALGDERAAPYAVTAALERTGEPGFEALLQLARDDAAPPTARGRALEALRRFDSHADAIRQAAGPLLKSDQPALRLAAAATLARQGDASEAVLSVLVDALKVDDYNTHRHATDAFGQLGSQAAAAIPSLAALLSSEDANTRRRALWALQSVGQGPETSAEVAGLLLGHVGREPDEGVREEIGRALSSLGHGADPVIAETLKTSRDKPVLLAGLRAWGDLDRRPPRGMAEVVRPLLSHEDGSVALAAAVALARIAADARALPVLVAALRSDDEGSPRYDVLEAVGELGEDAAPAVPELIELMRREEAADTAAMVLGRLGEAARPAVPALAAAFQSPRLNGAAGQALAELGPVAAGAVPVLLESLRYEPRFHAAVRVLAQMGPLAAPAVPVLTGQLKDEYRRAGALWGLGELGSLSADAVPAVAAALADEDPQVRTAAATALGAIGPPALPAVPQIIARLEDPEAPVRAAAVRAVDALAAPAGEVVAPLLKALEDESPLVRQPAASALGRLGAGSAEIVSRLIARHEQDESDDVKDAAARAVWRLDPAAARRAELPPPPPARAESAED